MEYMKMLVSYVILVVAVLVGVAFVTLMEQKILASSQVRLGPNYVGYWGLFQPFADAVKLFNKETVNLHVCNGFIYIISPIVSLWVSLVLWLVIPFEEGGYDFMFGVLFFICVSSLGVYSILSSGWSSNNKYSILGSMRAVAQMISYEVSLALVLLSLVWVSGYFSLFGVIEEQLYLYNFFLFLPLGLIWLISSLAETNRTPYDFAEGESELVSGFNTEYSAGGFTLIFMAEYASILFMSFLFVILFVGGFANIMMLKMILVSVWFIWVRSTMPRYRYDKLMYLAWKSLLPVSLFIFLLYLWSGCW
uniref:NADH dehydrogenase subunit 1 n=1 Tax=Charcotia amundseni TaxID=2259499 RepID=UPI001FF535A3|nr:NADH dehydrogenase subunit 1 [Charcotia amundseni]UIN24688.1 NADH dehydrogenase subunit 1 [Charcotia amundseni]